MTSTAGIRFKHNNGAFGKKYLPETLGSGVRVSRLRRRRLAGHPVRQLDELARPSAGPSLPALYRNNGNGTFTDVTQQAGLAVEMYGMGVSAADYDNDGDTDIYITALGPNHLFRNNGGGKFVDVTARAGVGDPGFSTSAVWFDYDRDGKLDLFVGNYVEWSVGQRPLLHAGRQEQVVLHAGVVQGPEPDAVPQQRRRHVRERDAQGRSCTIRRQRRSAWRSSTTTTTACLDLFVANDTQPNKLYRNKGDGTFADVGVTAGVAFNEAGVARAGMGADAADYDGSGRQSLIIGNFSNEMMALYSNEGNGLFIDEAPTSTIGKASLLTLTFACFFFDFDLDGLPDIFAANGHVADDISTVQPTITYAQPPHLFRNLGGKKFEEVSTRVGAAFAKPAVARGAAYGDFDNDGDLDIVVTANNGPARLFRNDGGVNHTLRVTLAGSTSNRDAVGAKVRVIRVSGAPVMEMVKTGSSYLSQSERALTFGLGGATKVGGIEIIWPNGKKEQLPGVAGDESITIAEGKGVVKSVPLVAKR